MVVRIELASRSDFLPSPSLNARRGRLHLRARSQQYFLSGEKQVDQPTDHKQLMGILLQSAVTQLHKSEFQLHHLKYVLHLRPHTRFGPVLGSLLFVNSVLIAVATVSVVLRQGSAL